jgi:hypothetical protein
VSDAAGTALHDALYEWTAPIVIQFNASLPAGACGNIDAVVLDLASCQLSNILSL